MPISEIEQRTRKSGTVLPDLGTLPVRVPRHAAAQLLTRYFFDTSPRTLERWPLTWRRLNGKAHCETAELFAVAASILEASPPVMGGQRLAA